MEEMAISNRLHRAELEWEKTRFSQAGGCLKIIKNRETTKSKETLIRWIGEGRRWWGKRRGHHSVVFPAALDFLYIFLIFCKCLIPHLWSQVQQSAQTGSTDPGTARLEDLPAPAGALLSRGRRSVHTPCQAWGEQSNPHSLSCTELKGSHRAGGISS